MRDISRQNPSGVQAVPGGIAQDHADDRAGSLETMPEGEEMISCVAKPHAPDFSLLVLVEHRFSRVHGYVAIMQEPKKTKETPKKKPPEPEVVFFQRQIPCIDLKEVRDDKPGT